MMIASRSLGSTPASSRARRAARNAMSALPLPSSRTRRSLIPVRTVIHSSLVSTIFSRSRLVTTLVGSSEPVPKITLRRCAALIAALRKITQALVPPKPKELDNTTFDIRLARFVGHIVEIALGVGIFIIDRRRNDTVVKRQHGIDAFDGASRAEQVTRH